MLAWAREQLSNHVARSFSMPDRLAQSQGSYPLEKQYFHPITSIPIPGQSKPQIIAYVDGGQADIIATPDSCISLIRTVCVVFTGKQRTALKKFEFFCSVTTTPAHEISYAVAYSPNELLTGSLLINSWDKSLMEGFNRVRITKVAELIRKCAEIKTIEYILHTISTVNAVVWDGSLDREHPLLEEAYQQLMQLSERKITILGLSKTCGLLTQQGRSVIDVLRSLAPEGMWYYQPELISAPANSQALIVFVKLHSHAKHIFRMDSFTQISDTLWPALTEHSSDPVFLGYPYGLILCDQLARVSHQEKELFFVKLKTSMHQGMLLENSLKSTDAHSILNNIMYS